ncbi:IS4 family transposase, partial [Acinetobacter baumannii]|nr:IS4 family transposase [Acinetobacter baumannii]
WQHDQKKAIKIKKHGRLSMSLFRYGFDFVSFILNNYASHTKQHF